MFGFYNMVLRINLSQESFELKMISDQVLRSTLGGKGLAAHLFRESKPDQSGRSTHDNLVFATGPVTGSMVPGALCCGVFTRLPEKGYGADYFSGSIAECMAGTGFDAVVVNGASDRAVWIEVCEGGSFFHPGGEIAGRDAVGTAKRIERWMRENRPAARKFGVVCVGDDAGGCSGPPGLETCSWVVDGKSDAAALLFSENVKAFVFWGGKERVLAHPVLIRGFASEKRSAGGRGDLPVVSGGEPALMKAVEERSLEAEYLSVIQDSLIVRDSTVRYDWKDLGVLIKGATGLELGREALRSIARSLLGTSAVE